MSEEQQLEVFQEVPEPNKWLGINPYIFKYAKGAVNYDQSWEGKRALGETRGFWVSRPWYRGKVSQIMEAAYQKLKEDGQITWSEEDYKHAFLFTQENAIRAAQKYIELCVSGQLKAKKQTWGPNLDVIRGLGKEEDKSRFFLMVPEELALKYGFTMKDDGTYEKDKIIPGPADRIIVTYEELVNTYPELYMTSQGYINKAQKRTMIDHAISRIRQEKGDPDHTPTYQAIANEANLKLDDVKKLMEEPTKQEKEVIEQKPLAAPNTDFTEFEDVAGAVEPEDLTTEEDDMVEKELGDVERDIERDITGTDMAVAAVIAAELPTNMGEDDMPKEATKVENEIFEVHDMNDALTTRIKHFTNASMVEVDTESIKFEMDGGRERQDYLCFLPGLETERWLPVGLHWIGDATGQCYLYEVYLGEDNDPIVDKIEQTDTTAEPDTAA